jgi:hypothetical protein
VNSIDRVYAGAAPGASVADFWFTSSHEEHEDVVATAKPSSISNAAGRTFLKNAIACGAVKHLRVLRGFE